jgi:uncharacterized protein (TIGR03083 family)
MSDQEIVDKLERVWNSIADLCSTFTETEWNTPTDCPKWSVQDHVSHIIGTELRLLGRQPPAHTPQDMGHVKNDIGTFNEVWVDWRRSWHGAKVLEEFREVTGERLELSRLWSLGPEQDA